ncbi:unnamed protein product [Oreochromis niloticus]|nr:unnamed protein product [Mustela putorius furo]
MERALKDICVNEDINGRLGWFHYVDDAKTWTEAQSYCQQNHTDLASIENTEEMKQLNSTVSSAAHSSELWIGLYSQIRWRWSDGLTGSGADYRNWDTSEYEPDFYSGVQFLKQLSVYVLSVKRQVVKLTVHVEDPPVDLNDSAVKAELLTRVKEQLKKKGVGGVSVRWRVQPYGKLLAGDGRRKKTLREKEKCFKSFSA